MPIRSTLSILILISAMWAESHAVAAQPAAAESLAPPGRVATFFRWGEVIPEGLREALIAYEEGDFLAARGKADAVLDEGAPIWALDDAGFLRALSLVGLGWHDQAIPSLEALLQGEDPGPYYVPALRELIEIHDRAGRAQAVADAWSRYVDRPLRSPGSRAERIVDLLYDFGTLRPPDASLSQREKKWLSKPEELEVVLEKRRERIADRICYRAGLALQRLGRRRESLDALLRIGVTSPYWPYARYSISQNLYALGDSRAALQTLTRLARYPAPTPEEEVLRSQARVLRAAMVIEGGDLESGIAIADPVAGDDPIAPRARLLVAQALLRAGKPALAVVHDAGREGETDNSPAFTATHGLVLGSAYAELGDRSRAESVVRNATQRVGAARIEDAEIAVAVARLTDRADRLVRDRLTRESARRAHLIAGITDILAHDGPWSFATMLRRIRAVLGAGSHVRLARGVKAVPRPVARGDEIWLAYLRSPNRNVVEDALIRLESPQAAGSSEAAVRLRARIDEELRVVVRERNAELGLLILDLEVALANVLGDDARQTTQSAR